MLLFREKLTLGLWIRHAAGCFKCGFMGHTSRKMEDSHHADEWGLGLRGFREEY